MSARKQGRVWVQVDTPPLYVAVFEGVPSDEDFQAYLDETLRLTKLGELHAMVFDATHAGMIPPSQRKLQGDWMREHDKLNRELTVACAFVLPNPLLRGLLTAILWLHPMPCAYGVFARREDAIAFCEGALAAKGIRVRRAARVHDLSAEP